jgi:hypothetical protein
MFVFPAPYVATVIPTLAFLDSAATDTNQTSYTFALTFGTAAASRKLLLVFATRTEGTSVSASSATIGGVSAAKVTEAQTGTASGSKYVVMYIADVPTGTSGNYVVNLSGSGGGMAGIAVYRITDLSSSTAFDTMADQNEDPLANTLDIPANGFAVGVSAIASGSANAWTGLTENVDTDTQTTLMRFGAASASSMTVETERAIECNGGGTDGCIAAASFGN